MTRSILYILFAVLSSNVLLPGMGLAQTQPDAGRILQEIEPERIAPTMPSADVKTEDSAATSEDDKGGAKVQLKAVVFEGNTLISDTTLQKKLPDDVFAQRRDLAALRDLTRAVTRHYRKSGYPFATAYLPPQKLDKGQLTIRVLEGRYSRITTRGKNERLTDFAKGFLTPLQTGEVIEGPQLERTTLIIGDQPGMSIEPVLAPGEETGTGDLQVTVSEERQIGAALSIDNHGNRYSGEFRTRGNLNIDRLLLPGDQLRLQGLYTEDDLWLGGVRYGISLGNSGLRGYIRYARTEYDLRPPFDGFTGTADIAEAGFRYPLIRSLQRNIDLTTAYRFKDLSDEVEDIEYAARKIHSLPLGIRFDNRDNLLGGGITFGRLALIPGRVDANIGGGLDSGFTKVEMQVARQQQLPAGFQAYAKVQGQWTDVPVPAAEAISLGGAQGVRAYPQGEGTGSRGMLARTELRRPISQLPGGHWVPFVFFDTGKIQSWEDESHRTIAGGGLGLKWRLEGWYAEGAAAWKSKGGDPHSDTHDRSPRLWCEFGYRF